MRDIAFWLPASWPLLRLWMLTAGLVVGLLLGASPAAALTSADALAVAAGDSDERAAAVQRLATSGDAVAAAFLEALLGGDVRATADRVFIVREGQARDAASGAPVALPAEADDVVSNNRLRREIEAALAALRLFSPDAAVRSEAVKALRNEADAARLPMVRKAEAAETDPAIRAQLALLRAGMELAADDKAVRMAAARALGESANPGTKTLLTARLARDGDAYVEPDAAVRAQIELALRAVDGRLAWGERLGAVFSGVSLGSILLLAALGLAITYGLMGVINMAHGELIMVGAYATWLVQNAFRAYLPQWFDGYLAAAIPAAFVASALVGIVLERTVIRWLYGRPLETLLATWGISLILMQAVRTLFGAQNVQVENPSWLSGGLAVAGNLVLPWNRIAIIAFAAIVLAGVALVLARTRLGLFVRGVTQNRQMAACVGVSTARVDTLAFGLGSGMAGLAGCALSQIGNVGPDLGQSYIVDSFMVVVLGGVGQLAGSVYAALGLGVFNKFLEGYAGAVLAKIAVLVFIIVFIQKRPQGLFALKGRQAEA